MSQPSYPSLSAVPDLSEGFRKQRAYDPTIRDEAADGYVFTRARHTSVPYEWWFTLRDVSQTDMNSLDTFETTTVNFGATVFKWTDPSNSTLYYVQFAEPLQSELEKGATGLWIVKHHLIQALGSYS